MACLTTRNAVDIFAKRPVHSASHALQIHRRCESIRHRVRHTWRFRDLRGSEHSHFVAGKALFIRRFPAGPGRQYDSGQQCTPLALVGAEFPYTESRSRHPRVSTTTWRTLRLLTYWHKESQNYLTNAFWYPNQCYFSVHNPPCRRHEPRVPVPVEADEQ